jgi:hypothetical protein
MAKFTRKGLHRLECPMCDGFAYATVATLERRGLPPCWCGEVLQPTELELAMMLDAVDSRPMVDYLRECNRVAKGQQPHVRQGRDCRAPELVAAERVEVERRELARARRRAGLSRVVAEAMPF